MTTWKQQIISHFCGVFFHSSFYFFDFTCCAPPLWLICCWMIKKLMAVYHGLSLVTPGIWKAAGLVFSNCIRDLEMLHTHAWTFWIFLASPAFKRLLGSGGGIMISKMELVLLGVMIIGWSSYIEANIIVHADMTESSVVPARNDNICRLCKNFTTQAINFLKENKTQTEIISSLHQICSYLYSLQQQCDLMVDNYMSIFTVEIAKIQPKQLCKKVKLCDKIELVRQIKHDDPCTICHNVVNEVLTKLDDPEAQLEIIQSLLKGCNRIKNLSQQCKRLVLEYGPIILANAEKFFQKNDVCAAIHACQAHQKADFGQELIVTASA